MEEVRTEMKTFNVELKCDKCNKPIVRVYSSIGVTFNGSGFYKTDNRK